MNTKKVYKYTFDLFLDMSNVEIYLPIKTEILDVQYVGGTLNMWYSFPTDEIKTVLRRFRFIATGYDEITVTAKHIKTLRLRDELVFHLFEV